MEHESGYFSSYDHTQLFFRGSVKRAAEALIVVHGFGEHGGRYEALMKKLEDLPCSVFVHDLRGHGKSGGERVYVNRFEEYLEDLARFKTFIQTRFHPEICKFHLLGHSMGGTIAALSAASHPDDWRSLIMLSPFFALYSFSRTAALLLRCLEPVCPKVIWRNPVNPYCISHDPTEMLRYKNDPWIQRRITFRLAKEMLRAGKAARQSASKLALPLLIVASGEDRIASLRHTKHFFSRIRDGRKRMHTVKAYHDLLHDFPRDEVVRFVRDHLTEDQ